MPVAATRLTDDQLQETEGAFTLIKGKPQALLFYVDFTLKTGRAPKHYCFAAFALQLAGRTPKGDETRAPK